MKVITDIEPDDEYYVGKAIHDNYTLSFWFKLGGLLLGGKNGGPVAVPIVFFLLVLVFDILMPITSLKTMGNDMEVCYEGVHFVIMISIECVFVMAFNVKRKTIIYMFTQMGKNFYDYQNTLHKESIEEINVILDGARRRKRLIANAFILVVLSCCFSITVIRPLFEFFEGKHFDDGILRLLPVPIWTPFGNAWYVTMIFFIVEDVIAYITPGIVFGCTLFIVCTCEDLGAQLKILGHSLKTVKQRAEQLDMPKEEALKLCFKHSIIHHQCLLKFVKDLENILFIPGFGLLFGSTILLCMSGFIFVSKEVSFISKLVFCLFLLSELAIISIFCWYGEYIQQTSTEICEMVYSSEWMEDMKTMKTYILIIQIRSRRPIKLNFGGFIVASLETLGNICSTAFSYFNLMLAVN